MPDETPQNGTRGRETDADGLPLAPAPAPVADTDWARSQLAYARWKAQYDKVKVEPPGDLAFADTLPLWEALPDVFDGDDLYGLALDEVFADQATTREARRQIVAYAEGCILCWRREGRIKDTPRDEKPFLVNGQLPGHLIAHVSCWTKE
ncbi:MAG: hypothetical protein RhofKO_39590 [Rhodothermales bacterium]